LTGRQFLGVKPTRYRCGFRWAVDSRLQNPAECALGAGVLNNSIQVRKMEKDKAILVIEDDVVTREMIKIIFVEQGYEVSTAFDGVDAVLRLTKRNFDLILCDIFMPSLNGFQLLEFLNRKKLSIPVIFLTASDKVEDEIKGLMLGAKDYIRKPINKSTMLIRAERVINNSADKIDQISLDHSTLVPEGEKKAKSLCYDS